MKKLLLLIFVLFLPFSVLPWGNVGHETVAYIAEKNLSLATLEKLKPLLNGETLEEISTWADTYKRNHKNTGPWHYIDLPVRENILENDLPKYYSQKGHDDANIVSQLENEVKTLKDESAPMKDRQVALKFLVHFVGDIHMPLHCSDDNDRGGNEKKVKYFSPKSMKGRGHTTNLHSLWDNLIEVKAAESYSEYGEELNHKIGQRNKLKWQSGTFEDWAFESYSIAKEVIYADMPAGPAEKSLPKNYHHKMRKIADEQIEKAGVRLAYVLEGIFGK